MSFSCKKKKSEFAVNLKINVINPAKKAIIYSELRFCLLAEIFLFMSFKLFKLYEHLDVLIFKLYILKIIFFISVSDYNSNI